MKLSEKIINFIRNRVIKHRQSKLSKKSFQNDVSIICNNCTGGVMYHDLKLQFLSPTINLFFGNNMDFLNFIKNLKQYVTNGKLIESLKKEDYAGFRNTPIGLLTVDNLPEIEIHFIHYRTFEEAKRKWDERAKRVNWKKIFILIEAQTEYEIGIINEYLSITEYPMVIFTRNDVEISDKRIAKMKYYDKYGIGFNHPILRLINLFGKRGYDEYDFINNIFNYF